MRNPGASAPASNHRSRWWARYWRYWHLGSSALLLSTVAHTQETVDPDIAQRVTAGFSPGPAPTSAVNVTRARQAGFAFPRDLVVAWRARVTAPITLQPVVDGQGNVLLLHERGSLSSLDATGKLRWSLRFADAAPAVAPSVLSSGTLAIVTHDLSVLSLDPSGTLLGRAPLGLKGKPSAVLPLVNGGIAIAVGDSLVQLDHETRVVARTRAEAPIVDLLQSARGVLLVTEDGQVHRVHGTGRLRPLGAFGTKVDAVALAQGHLFGIADQQLLSLNLANQRVQTLHAVPATRGLRPWLALGDRTVYVASADGSLRSFDPTGKELFRLVLSDTDHPTAPPLQSSNIAPALADRGRQAMVARAGSETMVVEPDGAHRRIEGSACLSPTALVPLRNDAVLLACRSGELLGMHARPAQ